MSNVPVLIPGGAGGGALAGWDKLFDGTITKTNPETSFDLTNGAITEEMLGQYDMLIISVSGSLTCPAATSNVRWGICSTGTSAYYYDDSNSFSEGETVDFRLCKLATRINPTDWYIPSKSRSSNADCYVSGDPLKFGVWYTIK